MCHICRKTKENLVLVGTKCLSTSQTFSFVENHIYLCQNVIDDEFLIVSGSQVYENIHSVL